MRKVGNVWVSIVTRGYAGNYEHQYNYSETWRDAHDWAYDQVKEWRP